jgi:hypothetical protein
LEAGPRTAVFENLVVRIKLDRRLPFLSGYERFDWAGLNRDKVGAGIPHIIIMMKEVIW